MDKWIVLKRDAERTNDELDRETDVLKHLKFCLGLLNKPKTLTREQLLVWLEETEM